MGGEPMTTEQRKENMRRWRAANPEKALEQSRESTRRWRAANPENKREKDRCWRAANLEKAREAVRRHYTNHVDKERVRALSKVHRRRACKLKTGGDFTPEQFKALCRHFH